jgi:methylamine utilization protein MauE
MGKYRPLWILILIAALAGLVLQEQGVFSWMHKFMGFFFCQFAMLKLFNPSGFAEGFRTYDFLAQKISFYARLYPWIELALGLAYLGSIYLTATAIVTLLIMTASAVSVIRALKAGLDTRCACMGTALNVPLSTVTLTEDIAMGLMAIISLAY